MLRCNGPLVPTLIVVAFIPWMVLLAALDPVRWFGSSWLRMAWLGLDAVLTLAFGLLAWMLGTHRPGWRRLAWLLLLASLADPCLALLTHAVFHVPHIHSATDALIAGAGIAASALAAGWLAVLLYSLPTKSAAATGEPGPKV